MHGLSQTGVVAWPRCWGKHMKKLIALAALLMLSAPALADLLPGTVTAGETAAITGTPVTTGDPPVTYFTANGQGFIASIFPSTSTGDYTNDTGPISLPLNPGFSVPAGFVVLMDPNNPTDYSDQADWKAVLEFVPTTPGGTTSTQIELLSPGAAFPSVSTVLAGLSNNTTTFQIEATPAGPGVFLASTFFAGLAEYDIYQVESGPAPAAGVAPEPVVAILMLTLAASGLTLLRRPQ